MLNFLEKLDYLMTAKNSRKEDWKMQAFILATYTIQVGVGHHEMNLCKTIIRKKVQFG